METIEYVLFGLLVFCIGLFLGIYFEKFKQSKKEKRIQQLSKHQKTISSTEELAQVKEIGELTLLAQEIIQESEAKCLSFIKVFEFHSLHANISKRALVKKIIELRKSVYFDELVDLYKESFYDCVNGQEIKRRNNVFLTDEEALQILSETRTRYLSQILKDENFKNNNSLRIVKLLDEDTLKSNEVINYFCSGDGKKYWDNEEIKEIIIYVIVATSNNIKELDDNQKAFLNRFSEETQIICELALLEMNGFSQFLYDCDKEKLANVINTTKIDISTYMLNFLEANSWFFKFWLEKTEVISDDELFSYLVWNDILPERFKKDKRYLEALNVQKNYKAPERDFETIKSYPLNQELVRYLCQIGDDENYLENCLKEKTFVPCLFWNNLNENGEFEKLSQKEASNIVEGNTSYTEEPFIYFSYIFQDYKLGSETLYELCENGVVELAQLYFEKHHKQHFI